MAAKREAANANLAILVFSKTTKQTDAWDALVAQEGSIRICLETLSCKILTVRPLDPHTSGDESRVYEILSRFDPETVPLTLSKSMAWHKSDCIKTIEAEESVLVMFQPIVIYRAHKTPGLAVFDTDSTLIQQEVIDELARAVGRYEQVAAVTEAATPGDFDFEASLRARVTFLKGVPTDIWEKMKKEVITFTPGASELIRALKNLGWKTAVLIGGSTPLALWVKDTLGLDYAYANQLVADSSTDTLTGELVPDAPIVHATKKRDLLLQLASGNDILTEHTIAVGDGSNDLLMMAAAGLGIAFNAKPKVQAAAPVRLNSESLLGIMYVLGFTQTEITDTLSLDGSSLDGTRE